MEKTNIVLPSIDVLVRIADLYKAASGVHGDNTVSWRLFGDTKLLSKFRLGKATITVKRYNAAILWFRDNWPEGEVLPKQLSNLRNFDGSKVKM